MCWGPRGVTQVRPTSRSTCVTDSRSNLISGPLSSPMVHVVWPLTYTHGPNTHTTHTRGHSDLTLGLSDLCSAYLASHGLAGLAVPERTVQPSATCNGAPATRPPRRTDDLLVVGGGGREGRSDLAPGLPDDLSPLRGRCRRRRFHGSSGPAVVSARDEAPCFGSVAGLHRVLQRGDIEASVGTTLAPPASHSRSSASVGGGGSSSRPAAGAASAPSAAMTVAVTVPSACDCATAASA